MNFHYARYKKVKKSVPPNIKNEASDHLNYFHMNPQTTNALTFLLHIILAIGGVLWQQPCVFEQN